MNQTETSVRVEFSLVVPESKHSIATKINTILADLRINHDSDLYSLSYACQDNFVQKIIIHFKSSHAGEAFFRSVSEDFTEHFQNIIKNIVDAGDEVLEAERLNYSACRSPRWSLSSTDESIYVVNENCSYVDNENMLELETKFYGKNQLSSAIRKSNEMLSFDNENEVDFLSSKFLDDLPTLTENKVTELASDSGNSSSLVSNLNGSKTSNESVLSVRESQVQEPSEAETTTKESEANDLNEDYLEIISDKEIGPGQLDTILIFFENELATSGGEILDYCLKSKAKKPWEANRLLRIKYRTKKAFNNVREKGLLTFEEFTFEVSQEQNPGVEEVMELDPKAFILTGCHSIHSKKVVRMLAENLSQDFSNSIELVEKSEVFADTFLVKFTSEIDRQTVKERFQRSFLWSEKKMRLIEVESTRCLALRSNELVEDSARELKYLEDVLGVKVRECNGLKIVEFRTEEELEEGNAHLRKVMGPRECVIESLYSFDLLKEDPVKAKEHLNDSKMTINQSGLIIGLIIIASLLLQNMLTDPSSQKNKSLPQGTTRSANFRATHPSIILDSEIHPNYKVLYYFYETQFEQFATDLMDTNTIAVIAQETPYIKLVYSQNFEDNMSEEEYRRLEENWLLNLNKFLNNYFSLYQIKVVFVNREIIEKITYNRLRLHIKALEGYKDQVRYEITGFKDSVKDLLNRIQLESAKKEK